MKKTLIYIISVIGLFSCDLDEVPVSEVSKEPVFSTENGLELYANSFYEILPTPSAAHQADNMCDYAARALVPNFILADAYGKSFGTSITLSRIVRTHGYRKALG